MDNKTDEQKTDEQISLKNADIKSKHMALIEFVASGALATNQCPNYLRDAYFKAGFKAACDLKNKTISEKDQEIESLSKENKELHSFPAINIYWKNLKAREDLESKLKIAISSIEAAVDEIDNCGFILTANLILNNALAKIRGEG